MSIYDVVSRLRKQVLRGALDGPLKEIHDLVLRVVTEPACTGRVFGSRSLDELCCEIGKKALALHEDKRGRHPRAPTALRIAYLVTKLQKSGGHTRVIENFIKARPDHHHVILSTELDGASDAEYLLKRWSQFNVIFESAPRGAFVDKLIWMQQQLMSYAPECVYLFNHHQDVIVVSAVQPEMGLDGWFYHHGDHHLCLGVFLRHLRHIDPHSFGYYNCRKNLGIENSYMPLAVEDRGKRIAGKEFMSGGFITTCTAARSNKVESPYFVNYIDVVPAVIEATGGRHVHIGRLTPWAVRNMKRSLIRRGIAEDRLVYIEWVPSIWEALQENNVDLYIGSFPLGGALTLIEAMGSGVPVALHRHIGSPLLGGAELAYPGAFCWGMPKELLDYCASMTCAHLAEQSVRGRKQYESYYSMEAFVSAVRNSGAKDVPPEPETALETSADEWAVWMESQFTFRRLVRRKLYRGYKHFRSIWSG